MTTRRHRRNPARFVPSVGALVLALAPSASAQRLSEPARLIGRGTPSADPTIALAAPIVIDAGALRAAAGDPGVVVRLALPDAPALDVRLGRRDATGPEGYTAVGRTDRGDVVFVVQRAGVLVADIVTRDGFAYQIRPTPEGGSEIRRMDLARFEGCGCGGPEDAEFLAPPAELRSLMAGRPGARQESARGVGGGGACNEDGSTVDLLVTYTSGAIAAAGDEATLLANLDLAVLEMNQALANSGVSTAIHVVGTLEVAKTWATSSSAAILNSMSTPGDGTLDELQGLRDDYRADLVTLIDMPIDVCGRAYLAVGPGPTGMPELGFSLVNPNCMTAPTYALAHEIGHTFGLNHERSDAPCDANATSFAHAYVEPSNAFATIVATNNGVPRIPNYSNPHVDSGGMPTGVADDADNAASLIEAAGIVARFRDLDCNNNGVCDDLDISLGTSLDCDANGVPDECDPDLNGNGTPDACDIAGATSADANADAIPDEAEPARIYVDPSATGTGLGDSWADARSDLQAALWIARNAGGVVQEIWVAQGTYTPGPVPERARRFEMVSGVEIYGGFAGDETDLSQRDWRAHPTVLSGDLLADDGPDFANTEDNSVSVVWASYIDNTALLDGFFIRGGNCNYDTSDCWFTSYSGGAGVRNFRGDAAFRNCSIEASSANNGGGLFVVSTGSPDFIRCDFIGNRAIGTTADAAGGGAYLSAEGGTFCLFRDCRFLANTSNSSGAAIVNICQDGAFQNCLFSGNVCPQSSGAGMENSGSCGSSPTITNCTFAGNFALYGGAGIHTSRGHPIIANSLFWDNRYGANNWAWEWAQYASNQGAESVTFINCTVQRWSGYHLLATDVNDLDPLFVDADGPDDVYGTIDDDPSLSPGSPAIDSGDNDAAAGLATDLAGNPRIVDDPDAPDTGAPPDDAPYVDRGAYERRAPAPACAGDVNLDGATDVFDFAILSSNFGGTVAPNTNGDLTGDGQVDVFDFAILSSNFGCAP